MAFVLGSEAINRVLEILCIKGEVKSLRIEVNEDAIAVVHIERLTDENELLQLAEVFAGVPVIEGDMNTGMRRHIPARAPVYLDAHGEIRMSEPPDEHHDWVRPDGFVTKLVCEVCQKPATQVVQDIEKLPNVDGCARCSPFGNPHFFCERHQRDSITYPV